MGSQVGGSEQLQQVVDRVSWKQVGQLWRPQRLRSEDGYGNCHNCGCGGYDRLVDRVYHSLQHHQ